MKKKSPLLILFVLVVLFLPRPVLGEAKCLELIEYPVFYKNCLDAENKKKVEKKPVVPTPVAPAVEPAKTFPSGKQTFSIPETSLINPMGGTSDNPAGNTKLFQIAGDTIRAVTGIMGSITLAIFVYGGFLMLTAGGKPESIKKGAEAMLWSAVGIVIILSSYALLALVFKSLTG